MEEDHPSSTHQQPPPGLQSMRTLFKKYQRLKLHEIESDDAVLDSRKLNSAGGVEPLPGVPSSRLKSIFDQFAGSREAPDEAALKDMAVFSVKALPGLLVVPAVLSPRVQCELLSRLLHRDLSNPKHQTNLHFHHDIPYPVVQQGGFLQQENDEVGSSNTLSFFSYSPLSGTVFAPKDPTVHHPLSIAKVFQKSLRWITLGGQYDWTNKVYPKEEPPAFPPDIGDLLEGLFPGTKAQAAIVNFYSPGDTLNLHQDVSEECDQGLISVSLGCDGLFMIGLANNTNASDTIIIRLHSGDAVYMSKKARFAYHAVPKIIPDTCPSYLSSWPAQLQGNQYEEWRGWMNNKRINLNVMIGDTDFRIKFTPPSSSPSRKWESGTNHSNRTTSCNQSVPRLWNNSHSLARIFDAMDWKTLAKQKRDSTNALIPEKWLLKSPVPPAEEQRDVTGKFIQQFLTPREIEITETDAVGIVKNTTTGTWKAREVIEAFCHRAAMAHQMVNCLHEIFFTAALEDAQKLDDYYAKYKAPIGPLHGLPISLKDQFHVKGVETTMGYVGWIGTFEGKKGTGKEKIFESEMVRELRALGAVFYCKTSVPHTLMAGETMNNIIGYTWNPKNRNLATGGSSGGEGALIGLKGSPIGFGTDIGGSIRIPAAFNGLYGIRPSAGRLPYEGMANSMDGQNSILSVVGPLATSVGGLRLVMKAILSQQPWLHDPLVAEIPWRDEQEQAVLDIINSDGSRQLVFGILNHDGVIQPQPPVNRAMVIIAETIRKLGHRFIMWDPPSHARALELAIKTWKYDGGADIHAAFGLSDEPISPPITAVYGTSVFQSATASEIAENNVEKRQYQKEYMEYWNSTTELTGTGRPVDAFICPVAPFPATVPNKYDYYGYTMFVNLLDYTAAVIPVMTVDKKIDVKSTPNFQPLNERDATVQELYDPELFDGAHVSVQIVGRRFQEEKILALSELLGDALGKHEI